ncbi:MAG: DNA/RNA nuclease SfsA [Promethearchaeota archaeon]
MKITGELHKGAFLRRLNRFVAEVEVNNEKHLAHVADPGRMKELLVTKTEVLLRKIKLNDKRRTNWDMLGVYTPTGLVSVDSRLPNDLIAEALKDSRLKEFSGYELVRREYTYGSSRFDFLLQSKGKQCLLEVKSCTLVKNGHAFFPDAPTTRGRRHLLELIKAKHEGYRACVIFVIQRDDASVFSPNDEIDPQFGDTLRLAASEGIEIFAYRCEVTETSIKLKEQVDIVLLI